MNEMVKASIVTQSKKWNRYMIEKEDKNNIRDCVVRLRTN